MRIRRFISTVVLGLAVACSNTPSAITSTPTPTPTGKSALETFLARAGSIKTFRLEMKITVPDVGQLVYTGAVDATKRLMNLKGSIEGITFELVSTKDAVYMKLPPQFRQGGKPWSKTDISAIGGGGAGAFMSSDPGNFFSQLKVYAPNLTETGAAEVRGKVTTVFSGSFDFQDVISKLPKDQQERAREAGADLGSQIVPVKVYVGPDGLLYRQEVELLVQDTAVPFLMDFFDYGADVNISIPPASQVGKAPPGFGT